MGKRWSHESRKRADRRAPLAAVAFAAAMTLASATPALAADTTPPTITTPAVSFVLGIAGTSSAPIRISWNGEDDWSGIYRYQMQQSIDGAAWAWVTLPSLTSRSMTRTVSVGHEYRYRVRARDVAGNWSAFKDTGPVFRLMIYQENGLGFVWTGTWTRAAVSGAMGGYSKYSNENPATVKFTFNGRTVAWVGMPCSYCGMAPVYVDGTYVTSVNTQNGTQNGQQVPRKIVYQRGWSKKASHNIEIRPERTFLHPRVYVDAMLVLVPAS